MKFLDSNSTSEGLLPHCEELGPYPYTLTHTGIRNSGNYHLYALVISAHSIRNRLNPFFKYLLRFLIERRVFSIRLIDANTNQQSAVLPTKIKEISNTYKKFR